MPLYRARISTSICCPPIKQKNTETNKQTNLIDDVERKQTQCIVFLHFPWSTKFVECALGHPREHVNERVQPVLLVLLRERNHLQTKRQKGSIKEPIHQKHLTWKKKERQCQFEIYWICKPAYYIVDCLIFANITLVLLPVTNNHLHLWPRFLIIFARILSFFLSSNLWFFTCWVLQSYLSF